jgi:hypothetical protein
MKMKRIALLVLLSLLLVSAASAYFVSLSVPERVNAGETIRLTIENNVQPGFTTDVILYKISLTKREVARKTITFQGQTLVTTFSTEGFDNGNYQIEILDPTKEAFGGSSTTWKQFEVINRSSDLTLTSPTHQEYDGTLDLTGTVKDVGTRGVEVTVESVNAVVFGPEYIMTNSNDAFAEEIPIDDAGTYRVTFADHKGFISTVSVVVSPIATPTPEPTTAAPTTTVTTAPPTPVPTTAPQSPLPLALVLLAIAFVCVWKR